MATLVLTAVGTALGGPIGGALGAFVGQAVDDRLFAPRVDGPRLDSLAVQQSRYGAPLPLLFGRNRVTGTVVWATELTERRSTAGGKGRPKVTSFAYAADFAVALSARPVRGIVRVWADGALITRADGSLDVDGAMRLLPGDEDGAPDPLMEAEEGRGRTPALRGVATVVFEGLALESFGNRIPQLSFELDGDPLGWSAVVADLSDGRLSAGAGVPADGAAFAGGTRREALASLAEPQGWAVHGGVLGAPIDAPVLCLLPHDLGARRDGEPMPPVTLTDRPGPTSVALTFSEPARDLQPGRQRAAGDERDDRPLEHALPLVLHAPDAKALATEWLDRAAAGTRRAAVSVPLPVGLLAPPGALVRLPDTPGLWRVADWLLERMVVRLELEPVGDTAPVAVAADGGRALPATPPADGAVARVELFELPYLLDGEGASLFAAVSRARPRPVALSLRTDAGTESIGPSARPAVIGTVTEPPEMASALILDRRSALLVTLPADAELGDADPAALSAGANAALVGDEVLQWGRAEPLGGGRWRLSTLLRGRRGTEGAVGRALAGDRFVRLDADSLQPVAAPPGAAVAVLAEPGGADPAVASAPVIPALGARPLSPVHLTVRRRGEDVVLTWVRRSRLGWRWADGADAPLGEEREAYLVTVGDRTVEVAEPRLVLAPDQRPPGPLTATVRQLGTHGPSDLATIQETVR